MHYSYVFINDSVDTADKRLLTNRKVQQISDVLTLGIRDCFWADELFSRQTSFCMRKG